MKNKIDFNKKVIILSSIAGLLLILYLVSFIFTYDMSHRRHSSYSWMEEKASQNIDRIIMGNNESGMEFIKRNNSWFMINNGIEFPARFHRIEDFISIFSKRGSWIVRSSNSASHAGFGLEEGIADRVVFFTGNNVVLDVLVGFGSVFGNETTIRRNGNDEVRSGDNRIRTYISSPVSSWYNLKLFPEENEKVWNADDVQRLTVINGLETTVFTFSQRQWTVTGVENPDRSIIDSYIRTILNTEGDDFVIINEDDNLINDFSAAKIIVEFSNGKIETVNLTEPNDDGRRLAKLEGRELVYNIPSWSSGRLFRDRTSLEIQ